MAWWLMAVMPTRRPAQTRPWTRWAPQYVLPVPGGPWIEMQLPSRCVTQPHMASRSSEKVASGWPAAGGEPRVVPAEQAERRRIGSPRPRGRRARPRRARPGRPASGSVGPSRARRRPWGARRARPPCRSRRARPRRSPRRSRPRRSTRSVRPGSRTALALPLARGPRRPPGRASGTAPLACELLPLGAVPGLQSHELQPGDDVGVVEQLRGLEAGARHLGCLVGTELAHPVAQQIAEEVLGSVGSEGVQGGDPCLELGVLVLGVEPRVPPGQSRRGGARPASRAGPRWPARRPRCRRRSAPRWWGRVQP